MSETPHEPDAVAEPAADEEPEVRVAGLAGLPLPAIFSPAALDAAPGDVCGPDGC